MGTIPKWAKKKKVVGSKKAVSTSRAPVAEDHGDEWGNFEVGPEPEQYEPEQYEDLEPSEAKSDLMSVFEKVMADTGFRERGEVGSEPDFPQETENTDKVALERRLMAWSHFAYNIAGSVLWYEAAVRIFKGKVDERKAVLRKMVAGNGTLKNDMQRKAYVDADAELLSLVEMLTQFELILQAQTRREDRAKNVVKLIRSLLYYGEDAAGRRHGERAVLPEIRRPAEKYVSLRERRRQMKEQE